MFLVAKWFSLADLAIILISTWWVKWMPFLKTTALGVHERSSHQIFTPPIAWEHAVAYPLRSELSTPRNLLRRRAITGVRVLSPANEVKPLNHTILWLSHAYTWKVFWESRDNKHEGTRARVALIRKRNVRALYLEFTVRHSTVVMRYQATVKMM